MKLFFTINKAYDQLFVHGDEQLRHFDEQYRTIGSHLDRTRLLYQESWDEINDDFSEYIASETGHVWFYDSYECVLSVGQIGISNWGKGAIIVRGWKENPFSMRRITAHELIISHYFEIHKRFYNNAFLTDNQIWALAEIAGFALTSLTSRVKDFWPWKVDYYTNHNYPQLVKLQLLLQDAFVKRSSFDEYISAGIQLIREHPTISPSGV